MHQFEEIVCFGRGGDSFDLFFYDVASMKKHLHTHKSTSQDFLKTLPILIKYTKDFGLEKVLYQTLFP